MVKITISTLECYKTEDYFGRDECELRIWVDGSRFRTLERKMRAGNVWHLGVQLELEDYVKVDLYEKDPNWPGDKDDHLGTVTVTPKRMSGYGEFSQDGAKYRLTWGPTTK